MFSRVKSLLEQTSSLSLFLGNLAENSRICFAIKHSVKNGTGADFNYYTSIFSFSGRKQWVGVISFNKNYILDQG